MALARASAQMWRGGVRHLATGAKPRVLVTGCLGQIGSELTPLMRKQYGVENVIATDLIKAPEKFRQSGPYTYLDVTDKARMKQMCVEHSIDYIVHMASILSATGEKNPDLAYHVNAEGTHNVLEVAKDLNLRVLAPSTIAVFGPETPKVNTPDVTPLTPTTMYGVTKVFVELLGNYYYKKYGVDFRSLRYPGIISYEAEPGGGTTDYAVAIYFEAIKKGKYECYLKQDAALPMMYMDDCLRATMQLMEAPAEKLSRRVYNVTAMSFTPAEVAASIKKVMPDFSVTYNPDFRQKIAESWPRSIDDSIARKDWNWKHRFDLTKMTEDMLVNIRKRLGK